MAFGRLTLLRFASIALMLVAWGVSSNRCALAALTTASVQGKAAAVHRCCPQKNSAGEEPAPSPREGDCCQSLCADTSGGEALSLKAPEAVAAVDWAIWWLAGVVREEVTVEAVPASSPPEFGCYAERVLQRSLLSHAPPARG